MRHHYDRSPGPDARGFRDDGFAPPEATHGRARECCPPPPMVQVCPGLSSVHRCKIDVPVCIPACCVDAPCVGSSAR